jgi:hypothetical protein
MHLHHRYVRTSPASREWIRIGTSSVRRSSKPTDSSDTTQHPREDLLDPGRAAGYPIHSRRCSGPHAIQSDRSQGICRCSGHSPGSSCSAFRLDVPPWELNVVGTLRVSLTRLPLVAARIDDQCDIVILAGVVDPSGATRPHHRTLATALNARVPNGVIPRVSQG